MSDLDPSASSPSADLALIQRPPRVARGPIATIVALAIVAIATIASPSCGPGVDCRDPNNAQNAKCIVQGALVDCTGVSSLSSAIAVVEPIIQNLIASALQPNGTINWPAIEQQIVDLALQYGMCVVAEVWNKYMHGGSGSGSAVGSGTGSGSNLGQPRLAQPSPADFTREFDRIRARVAPGRAFKTSGGQL